MHWGTFNLALHAWDEPAETLLALGEQRGARLLMPRLGEAVEPAYAADRVTPWWRSVDTEPSTGTPPAEPEMSLPKAMPWPID